MVVVLYDDDSSGVHIVGVDSDSKANRSNQKTDLAFGYIVSSGGGPDSFILFIEEIETRGVIVNIDDRAL